MPDAFIGVDVIVGMRGETEELFEESYRFTQAQDVSQLHVFSYSERPGTRALQIPHIVKPEEKHQRSQRLLALSEEKRKAHYLRFVGSERPVLWEHARAGEPLQGFTDNYIRVVQAEGAEVADNTLTAVCLGHLTPDGEALCQILPE